MPWVCTRCWSVHLPCLHQQSSESCVLQPRTPYARSVDLFCFLCRSLFFCWLQIQPSANVLCLFLMASNMFCFFWHTMLSSVSWHCLVQYHVHEQRPFESHVVRILKVPWCNVRGLAVLPWLIIQWPAVLHCVMLFISDTPPFLVGFRLLCYSHCCHPGLLHIMVSGCLQLCHSQENPRAESQYRRARLYGPAVRWQGSYFLKYVLHIGLCLVTFLPQLCYISVCLC